MSVDRLLAIVLNLLLLFKSSSMHKKHRSRKTRWINNEEVVEHKIMITMKYTKLRIPILVSNKAHRIARQKTNSNVDPIEGKTKPHYRCSRLFALKKLFKQNWIFFIRTGAITFFVYLNV